NGSLLNPLVDITPAGQPSASSINPQSTFRYSPSRAVDGNNATYWAPDPSSDSTPWWELDFGQPVPVKEIRLSWYADSGTVYGAGDFEIQGWDGAQWVSLQKILRNSQADNDIVLPVSTSVSAIRILITRGISDLASVFLAEVKVFKQPPITGVAYTDAAVHDGKYLYQLAAVNACGVEGAPAQASVAVGDVVAPASPLNLTARVSNADVSLQWSASTDPDLAGYNLYRKTGNGTWGKVNNSLITGTAFLDAPVPNGSYFYRVTALDHAGNESAPSNEAPATINVVDLSAPTPPILLYPTDAAHPKTVTADTTPIAGSAEPGSRVALLSQGISLGTVQTLSAPSSGT